MRDLTDKEFAEALARNDLAVAPGGGWIVKTDGSSKRHVGAVFYRSPFSMAKRETLRKAIREFQKDAAAQKERVTP